MKRFSGHLASTLALLLAFLTAPFAVPKANAQSWQVSLITCSPGHEVWSLYGHTALRLKNDAAGVDVAVNWGLFSLSQPWFGARFALGTVDYQMGIEPWPEFLSQYASEGRGVVEQVLRLTPEEGQAIAQAVDSNYVPAHRAYRYNYLYDNCSTRARDMVLRHLRGRLHPHYFEGEGASWREVIHQWSSLASSPHRWAAAGNDLLLGVAADRPTTAVQREFLPDTLRAHFDKTMVERNGSLQPLVAVKRQVIEPQQLQPSADLWDVLSPTAMGVLLLLLTLTIRLTERVWHYYCWIFDAGLLASTGVAGLILLFMVFSEQPTVRINFQILVLNPLSVVLLWSAISHRKKGLPHWWWQRGLPLCLLLFAVGWFVQQYTEGLAFVAAALALRAYRPRRISTAVLQKRETPLNALTKDHQYISKSISQPE